VAGVNGENRPREIRVQPGSWLPAGRFDLTTIADGADPRSFHSTERAIDSTAGFAVSTLPRGGFVAVLKPTQ